MNIINLTPHAIVVQSESGDRTTFAPSGTVARVTSTPGALVTIPGCPIPVANAQTFGEVEGLPAPTPRTIFIVSAMVLARCQDRNDVVGPGTGPNDGCIRNDKGHVEAVTRFVRG